MSGLKYNIGCGRNKWTGFINVDIEKSLEPDLVLDISKDPLPCEDGTVDEIWMFHTIEHISKNSWPRILIEFNRALKQYGRLNLAYPEFTKCVENWRDNKYGDRDYWEATLYGRQLYKGDYHVAIADTEQLTGMLNEYGFGAVKTAPEAEPNEYYTVLSCQKIFAVVTREFLIGKAVA